VGTHKDTYIDTDRRGKRRLILGPACWMVNIR